MSIEISYPTEYPEGFTPGQGANPDDIILSTEELKDYMVKTAEACVAANESPIRMALGDKYDGMIVAVKKLLAYKGNARDRQMHMDAPHTVNGYRVRVVTPNIAGQPVSAILGTATLHGFCCGWLNAFKEMVPPFQQTQINGTWHILYVEPWMRKHTDRQALDSGPEMISKNVDGAHYIFNPSLRSTGEGDQNWNNDGSATISDRAIDVLGYTVVLIDTSGNEDMEFEKGVPVRSFGRQNHKSSGVTEQEIAAIAGDVAGKVMTAVANKNAEARAPKA